MLKSNYLTTNSNKSNNFSIEKQSTSQYYNTKYSIIHFLTFVTAVDYKTLSATIDRDFLNTHKIFTDFFI